MRNYYVIALQLSDVYKPSSKWITWASAFNLLNKYNWIYPLEFSRKLWRGLTNKEGNHIATSSCSEPHQGLVVHVPLALCPLLIARKTCLKENRSRNLRLSLRPHCDAFLQSYPYFWERICITFSLTMVNCRVGMEMLSNCPCLMSQPYGFLHMVSCDKARKWR